MLCKNCVIVNDLHLHAKKITFAKYVCIYSNINLNDAMSKKMSCKCKSQCPL